jgi:hypothetical protein
MLARLPLVLSQARAVSVTASSLQIRDSHREGVNGVIWLVVLGDSIWAAMAEGLWHAAVAVIALFLAVANLWPLVSRRRRNFANPSYRWRHILAVLPKPGNGAFSLGGTYPGRVSGPTP